MLMLWFCVTKPFRSRFCFKVIKLLVLIALCFPQNVVCSEICGLHLEKNCLGSYLHFLHFPVTVWLITTIFHCEYSYWPAYT